MNDYTRKNMKNRKRRIERRLREVAPLHTPLAGTPLERMRVMGRPNRYSPGVREQAARIVFEHPKEYGPPCRPRRRPQAGRGHRTAASTHA